MVVKLGEHGHATANNASSELNVSKQIERGKLSIDNVNVCRHFWKSAEGGDIRTPNHPGKILCVSSLSSDSS